MRIECPKCATVLEVADDQAEKKGRCSSCKTKFLIPANSKDEIKIIDEKGGVKESKNLLAATKKMKADGLSASKTDDEKVTVNKKKEDLNIALNAEKEPIIATPFDRQALGRPVITAFDRETKKNMQQMNLYSKMLYTSFKEKIIRKE